MCKFGKRPKLNDQLSRPIISENLEQCLWNDKCDYIEIENCTNLNPNNYNLDIVQLNIRSLLSKQTELNQILRNLERRKSKVDIVMSCETFLSNQTSHLTNVPGYTVFADLRKTHKGGGTAILVSSDITCRHRTDLVKFKEMELESTFVEIQAKNGRSIVLGSLYRPPNCKEKNLVNDLNEVITR